MKFPLTPAASAALRGAITHVDGESFRRWTPAAFSFFWKRLVTEAKVVDLNFHDLRHTFATWLQNLGRSTGSPSYIAGHRQRGVGNDQLGGESMTAAYPHGGYGWNQQLREVVTCLHTALLSYGIPTVTFAYLTGWRIRTEIQNLTWRQVDMNEGIVRLEPGSTKNEEGRVLPFAVLPELRELLELQRQDTTQLELERGAIVPWVFHRNGHPIIDFRKAWSNACSAAGVAKRIPHDFRRTAVRNLERAGVPRSVAMKITGHKTEAVYRRYAIVSEADLSEGLKKLAKLHSTERVQRKNPVLATEKPQPQEESVIRPAIRKRNLLELVPETGIEPVRAF